MGKREEILNLVRDFHSTQFKKTDFIPGQSSIPVSGKVFDAEELVALVDSSLDFWLTTGRFNDQFEKKFSDLISAKFSLTVNSGSSANLVAVSSLTSPKLKERALKPGDEVITAAAGFPTTVNPIIQNQALPVFVDIQPDTFNATIESIEEAITDKTRAIILAHTLGNPYDVASLKELADKNNIWLIEDSCDALGSKLNGQMIGSFGDLSTYSFYPAHHITMGEGGAVLTSNGKLKMIAQSIRDWGRDCFCPPGKDNTCGKRFEFQLGDLPAGYDHKYIYSHIGYNLKITDMQAAVALAQLDKLPSFIEQRKKNFSTLKKRLGQFEEHLILPRSIAGAEASWFGFPMTIRPGSPYQRVDLVNFLNEKKVATRMIFAGNITKQPYFAHLDYRSSGDLKNTDLTMENSFWIGVFPQLNSEMLDYVGEAFEEFFHTKS